MPDKVTFIKTEQTLARILQAVERAPMGHKVVISQVTRSDDQNRKLWAMINDIVKAKPDGRSHSAEDWKYIFMSALGIEMTMVPTLDGQSFVPLGHRSSQLTKARFADLITVIEEYGARHGVQWSEPNPYEIWQ